MVQIWLMYGGLAALVGVILWSEFQNWNNPVRREKEPWKRKTTAAKEADHANG